MTKTDQKPPSLSPARQALAQAIEAQHQAARDLAAAQDAIARTKRKWVTAQDALDRLRKADADPGAELARAVIENPDADVMTLQRPDKDRAAAIASAEEEIALWGRAREACERKIEECERDVETAQRNVHDAVGAVVRDEIAVMAWLDELVRRQMQINQEAATLYALRSAAFPGQQYQSEWRDADFRLNEVARFSFSGEHEQFEQFQRWSTIIERLQAAADAPLPPYDER